MNAALIIGGLGIALIVMTPALRAVRARPMPRISDKEYFAAARKRAISYRLAKSDSTQSANDKSAHDTICKT